MKITLPMFLFFVLAACTPSTPSSVQDAASGAVSSSEWTNRVWVRSDEQELPGRMLIFLTDGSLVMDSCWETYRLSRWQSLGAATVQWEEDGARVTATLEPAASDELVLRLALRNDTVTQRYRAATVPYVCPDVPR